MQVNRAGDFSSPRTSILFWVRFSIRLTLETYFKAKRLFKPMVSRLSRNHIVKTLNLKKGQKGCRVSLGFSLGQAV
jgi:hypothetical protein